MSFRQLTNFSKVAGSYVGGQSSQRPILRSPPAVSTTPHVRHFATFARDGHLALGSDSVPALVVVVRIACKNLVSLRLTRPPADRDSAHEKYNRVFARAMPTYNSRRSSSTFVSSVAKLMGSKPSVTPTKNTVSHSRPLAE